MIWACRLQIRWCENLTSQMESGELAKDTASAENLMELHHERKAEIDGRYNYYLKQKDYGEALLRGKHPAQTQIETRLTELDDSWQLINRTWEERKQLLTQCYDLQVYEEYAEQADAWIASKEAFLANEDLGVSGTSHQLDVYSHTAIAHVYCSRSGFVVERRRASQEARCVREDARGTGREDRDAGAARAGAARPGPLRTAADRRPLRRRAAQTRPPQRLGGRATESVARLKKLPAAAAQHR